MIKKFTVTNFANFKDTITLDFTNVRRDYKYNDSCIKNGLINKAVIYGKNSEGKTNLGIAVGDIISDIFSAPYSRKHMNRNADAEENELIIFSYSFLLDGDNVDYLYKKNSLSEIVYEKFTVNSKTIFEYDLQKGEYNYPNVSDINADKLDWLEFEEIKKPKENIFDEAIEQPTALKYIISNTMQGEDSVIYKLTRFLKGMRFTQSLSRLSTYDILKINRTISTKELADFQKFLNNSGVRCELILLKQPDGENEIYFNYKKPLPFFEFMSSGTADLTHFYFRHHYLNKQTFIYLDEFDAHYHFELSKKIVEMLEEENDCQVVMTTHNTNLLDNSIMRPDCFMILSNGKLTPLCDATTRELRPGHNLEKLYINGEFDE